MHTRLEPPIDQWPTSTAQRPIWTGHQLTLFHPGILAKYVAASIVSEQSGVPFRNIVVDQDVYDPFKVPVPIRAAEPSARDGGDPNKPLRLITEQLSLGSMRGHVPLGMQPPARLVDLDRRLAKWPADAGVSAEALRDAFAGTDEHRTLAAQMDEVMRRLIPAYASADPSAYASQLLDDQGWLIDAFLNDAPRCAGLYNQAVKAYPGAGMTPMSIEPDRVEVPLWLLRWVEPRRKLYVDIADSTPIFVTELGEPVDPASKQVTLAPRALLMTALLRHLDRCSLFIHGTGGWAYDRITEQWWSDWQGEALAPIALATADVFLEFSDVPVSNSEDYRQAIWRAHHLPHNLDRELGLTHTPPAREKLELLARMDDDRDRARRRSAFELIHQINADLAELHPDIIEGAKRTVAETRLGMKNAKVAQKRDWSFLLYPPTQLETLRQQIAYPLGELSSEPGKPG